MILEPTLEQTKQSFPVPETWVAWPLAPTPMSAIETELLILWAHFRDSASSSTRKTGIFMRLATDATTNSIETPSFQQPGRILPPSERFPEAHRGDAERTGVRGRMRT